jgi:hypothetical protein
LIEQHPAAPAAIMPIFFLCLWLFVSATISVIGGWFSLAKVYRAQVAFDGTKWSGQSGQMRLDCSKSMRRISTDCVEIPQKG